MKKSVVWVGGWILLCLGWVGSSGVSEGRGGGRPEPLSQEGVVWARRYDCPAHRSDVAYAVAADASGSAIVTGGSDVGLHDWDYLTIKYGPRGGRTWVASYDYNRVSSTLNSLDIARALTLDESGNIYVTGASDGAGSFSDFATVKYDTNGDIVWAARTYWMGPRKSINEAKALVLDASKNIIVAGTTFITESSLTTKYDFLTVKYDSSGQEMWKRRFDGGAHKDDSVVAVGVDARLNIYVMGRSMERTLYRNVLVKNSDFRLVKYDKDGNLVWTVHRNSENAVPDVANAGGLLRREFSQMPITEIFLTGFSNTSAAKHDFFTIKFDADGGVRWEKRVAVVSGMTDIEAKAMAVDRTGNVYIAGSAVCPSSAFIAIKYDKDGNLQWTKTYDAGLGYNYATAVAVDSAGNAYVTGLAQYSSLSYFDYATVKYDTDGNEKWVRSYGYAAKGYDWPRAIAVDNKGYVYVTGSSVGVDTKEDYLTIKYRAD